MSALTGMTIVAVLLWIALCGVGAWGLYLREELGDKRQSYLVLERCYQQKIYERAADRKEFSELELAWGQLRAAVRQLCADVEASKPKRGADGRFARKP